MFEPFTVSEAAIEKSAANGLIPIGIMTDKDIVTGQLRAAQRGWAKAGKDYALGEGAGLCRYMIVADTDAEAREMASYALYEWLCFFTMFNFHAVMMRPGEDIAKIPNNLDGMIERQMMFCGSPDTVCRQFEAAFGNMPVQYLFILHSNELVPHRAAMRSHQLMTEKVLPHFTDRIR